MAQSGFIYKKSLGDGLRARPAVISDNPNSDDCTWFAGIQRGCTLKCINSNWWYDMISKHFCVSHKPNNKGSVPEAIDSEQAEPFIANTASEFDPDCSAANK